MSKLGFRVPALETHGSGWQARNVATKNSGLFRGLNLVLILLTVFYYHNFSFYDVFFLSEVMTRTRWLFSTPQSPRRLWLADRSFLHVFCVNLFYVILSVAMKIVLHLFLLDSGQNPVRMAKCGDPNFLRILNERIWCSCNSSAAFCWRSCLLDCCYFNTN